MFKLLEALDDNDDVQRVVANFEVSDASSRGSPAERAGADPGLDPGLRHTGWGVVEAQDNRLRFVACGAVHSDAADDLATRLEGLYRGLAAVIDGHLPREAAVEETVVNRNPLSSLKLGPRPRRRAAGGMPCGPRRCTSTPPSRSSAR